MSTWYILYVNFCVGLTQWKYQAYFTNMVLKKTNKKCQKEATRIGHDRVALQVLFLNTEQNKNLNKTTTSMYQFNPFWTNISHLFFFLNIQWQVCRWISNSKLETKTLKSAEKAYMLSDTPSCLRLHLYWFQVEHQGVLTSELVRE